MTKTKKNKNTGTKKTAKSRLASIDIMIGLAMILVVLGHMSVGNEPDWYSHGLRNWIYSFHMELFLFLSAFLIRHTYRGVDSLSAYFKYIWRKFKKFFVWFIVIGLAVALLACPLKGVPFSTGYIWQSLKTLLVYPRWSEASFLWYIYILFGYYLISPIFFKLPSTAKVVCCIAAMFLPMIAGTPFLANRDFCQYTFFYCLGVLCAEWIEEIRSTKVWAWGLMSVPFVAWTAWVFTEGLSIGFEYPQLGWWTTVTGTSALPFFYLISLVLKKIKPISKTLSLISVDCYWIYLLQMFIIWGCVKLVCMMPEGSSHPFIVFVIITTILAIALPIAAAEITKRTIAKHKQ